MMKTSMTRMNSVMIQKKDSMTTKSLMTSHLTMNLRMTVTKMKKEQKISKTVEKLEGMPLN